MEGEYDLDDDGYAIVPDDEEDSGKGWGAAADIPREPYTQADKVADRRTFMRKTALRSEPSFHEPPTLAQLEKHAERFGPEHVMETAIDLNYSLDALIRLQDACDRAEAARYKEAHPHAPAMRFGDAEARVRKAAGIPKDEVEEELAA